MTKLLEIREFVKNFYAKYENFIVPVLKFLLAFITFLMINAKLGFMEKFAKFPIALILALLCSFLPLNFLVLAASAMSLLHIYALSKEAALVVGIVVTSEIPSARMDAWLYPRLFSRAGESGIGIRASGDNARSCSPSLRPIIRP